MKNILKNYYKVTPIKWRALGDTFLGTGLFALGLDAINVHPNLSLGIAIVCVISKFITNFPVGDSK